MYILIIRTITNIPIDTQIKAHQWILVDYLGRTNVTSSVLNLYYANYIMSPLLYGGSLPSHWLKGLHISADARRGREGLSPSIIIAFSEGGGVWGKVSADIKREIPHIGEIRRRRINKLHYELDHLLYSLCLLHVCCYNCQRYYQTTGKMLYIFYCKSHLKQSFFLYTTKETDFKEHP